MKIIKLYFIVFCTLFILLYSTVMAYEEANYEVVSKNKVYEIRKYSDRLAVKTIHSSGENGAFRRLFNYISGANQSSSKIAMTIPVMQSNDDNGMAMHCLLYTSDAADE